MTTRAGKRKLGDMEVRILRDGRVVFLAPDEQLVEVAETLEPRNRAFRLRRNGDGDGKRSRN